MLYDTNNMYNTTEENNIVIAINEPAYLECVKTIISMFNHEYEIAKDRNNLLSIVENKKYGLIIIDAVFDYQKIDDISSSIDIFKEKENDIKESNLEFYCISINQKLLDKVKNEGIPAKHLCEQFYFNDILINYLTAFKKEEKSNSRSLQ